MIVDGFTFFNELDVLTIRLEELYPVVDRFVLVESNLTFRGHPKPYLFDENKELYTGYLDKVVHVKLIDTNKYSSDTRRSPWQREKFQRNSIAQGFADLKDDDVVMISDVDEIPRREIVEDVAEKAKNGSVTLGMKMYYYGLNVYDGDAWGGAKAVSYGSFVEAEALRHSDPPQSIANAGWHFSYLGDAESIKRKIQSFAHWELDTPDIAHVGRLNERMLRGEDIWGHGKKYQIVEIDETYPHAIRDNMLYYSKYMK